MFTCSGPWRGTFGGGSPEVGKRARVGYWMGDMDPVWLVSAGPPGWPEAVRATERMSE